MTTPEERTNQRYRDAITYAQATCTTHDHDPPVSNYRCCTESGMTGGSAGVTQ